VQDVETAAQVLPLVGIAALMLFGLVVFTIALTYGDAPVMRESRSDPMRTWKRLRQERERLGRAGRTASFLVHWQGAQVTARTLAMKLTRVSWPLLRRARWLSLESPAGQAIAVLAASVIAAFLLVALV
jgi:hypothetical protein